MALQVTDKYYVVQGGSIQYGPIARPKQYGPNSPDATLAADGYYRLWEDLPGVSPGKYYRYVKGSTIVDEGNKRVTRVDSWVEYTPAEKRSQIESEIENQRLEAEQSAIDLRADSGLVVLMDEANISADERRVALGSTDDAGLDAFDATLDPRAGNSIQVAASLETQERDLLAGANPFTAAQRTTLQAAADAHRAIVDAGDPVAEVPEVPSFARRFIGVPGEEYGRAYAQRTFENPWYWLEIGLWIKRNLDDATYFLAIYDAAVPDDRDDQSGYLSTAQLMEIEPGHFFADKLAINLARPDTTQGFKFTLCKGHIDFPQFDRVLLEPGDLYQEYRFRWNGLA